MLSYRFILRRLNYDFANTNIRHFLGHFRSPYGRFGHFRSPFPVIISTHDSLTKLTGNQFLRLIKTTHDSHRYLNHRPRHKRAAGIAALFVPIVFDSLGPIPQTPWVGFRPPAVKTRASPKIKWFNADRIRNQLDGWARRPWPSYYSETGRTDSPMQRKW